MVSLDRAAGTLGAGSVTHVVPGLVPGECGIGDYAVTIAQGLATHGIASRFVVAGRELVHRADEYDARGPFPHVGLATRDEAALADALADEATSAVVLHYSGYGYQANGVPDWLARGVAAARQRRRMRFVTFFHETWQKREWLSRALYRSAWQRRLAIRLCGLSDAIAANTRVRADALALHHPGGCETIPVFSNVGESGGIDGKDPGLAVTFGLGRRRQEAWAGLAARPELVAKLGVSKIIDIGSPGFDLPPALAGMTTRVGRLDVLAVDALLSKASTAFLCYGSDELGKSGAFAAFAAHRLCVVNIGLAEGSPDGLIRGEHYLQAEDIEVDVLPEECSQIASAAHAWYSPHNVAHSVARFAALTSEVAL